MTELSKPIIVISNEDDPHVSYVQNHLEHKIHCIDPSKVVTGVELSFIGNSRQVIYGHTKLTDVGAVWFRKPVPIEEVKLPVQESYQRYSADSLNRHMNALKASFQDAFWMSDYYAILKASNKTWQMEVAAQGGFLVPDTVITSSAATARSFIDTHDQVITKSLASVPPIVGDINMLPTMKITRDHYPELTGLHLAPAIFQQAIAATADVRVTVVGSKVYAAITHDDGVKEIEQVRDWRVGQLLGRIHFDQYRLPRYMAAKCVALVKRMGLAFGAIDLVMDKAGKLWFLEINPNGQWAFIEDDTAQPIGKAIAELLAAHAKK